MVDGPSLRQEAMLRFERPQSYLRCNTSLILFIGVLFFAMFASLPSCLRSKE